MFSDIPKTYKNDEESMGGYNFKDYNILDQEDLCK